VDEEISMEWARIPHFYRHIGHDPNSFDLSTPKPVQDALDVFEKRGT